MAKDPKKLKPSDAPERLKILRETMGWPMSELARRFGVTNSAVSQWESGESQMSGPALKLLEMYEKKASRFEEG